jgi:hypothetical protein
VQTLVQDARAAIEHEPHVDIVGQQQRLDLAPQAA